MSGLVRLGFTALFSAFLAHAAAGQTAPVALKKGYRLCSWGTPSRKLGLGQKVM